MRRLLNTRILRTLVVAGGVTAMLGGISAAPALAHDWGYTPGDYWRHEAWREHREHEWREQERRERAWREWRHHEWLERQRYLYGARPLYPPPVYYGAPSLSLGFEFR